MIGDYHQPEFAEVHHLGEDFTVGNGWINLRHVVAVRPVALDLSPLCPDCAEKARKAGLPPVLAVKMIDGSKYRLLGDGLHDDVQAVQQARRLRRMLVQCQREQHLPSGPLRGVASLPLLSGPLRGVASLPLLSGPLRGVASLPLLSDARDA
ncbi:hypothetical protein GCM10028801_35990 [Nocardioides maradonensis]